MKKTVAGGRGPRAAAISSLLVMALTCTIAFCVGCGAEQQSDADSGAAATISTVVVGTSSTQRSLPDTSEPDDHAVVHEAIDDAFKRIAEEMAPLPVYAPTYLPAGAEPAVRWWPITECTTPDEYTGPAVANPLLDPQDDKAISAQFIIRCPGGWLGVMQNLRGDLGMTPRKDAGQVAGHPAAVYDFDGEAVVQWSDEGLWYVVMGRGLPEDEVIRVAEGMRRVVVGGEGGD